jgi:RNA polymerase sigma factor (TIGR02999 family)
MSSPDEITRLLMDWSRGDESAATKLFPLVYDELHRLASSYMRRERLDHTLQTTALVHEAYLRMIRPENSNWQTRAHFFAAAARVMRNFLVDYARGRNRAKRGEGLPELSLAEVEIMSEQRADELIAIDLALEGLAAIDARKSKVFELRYFGGMSVAEAAEAMKVSRATVARDWRMAQAWMRRELGS